MILFTRIILMKIIVTLCIILIATQSLEVPDYSEEELQQGFEEGKQVWLVHRSSNPSLIKVQEKIKKSLKALTML